MKQDWKFQKGYFNLNDREATKVRKIIKKDR